MDRKTFLKTIAAVGASLPCWSAAAHAENTKCDGSSCMTDAGAVRQFLSDFLKKEETLIAPRW